LVNVPLILSRRSINQMLSVRIAVTAFSALTACQGVFLLVASPESGTHGLVPLSYQWAWGFYGSIAISVAATLLAPRFGVGPMLGAPSPPQPPVPPSVDQRRRQRLH
jgi:hypothetical protein